MNRAVPSYFVAVSNSPSAWISNGGGAQHGPIGLAQDGDVDLPAADDLLDEDPVVVAGGGAQGVAQLVGVAGQGDPVAGPRRGRLDHDLGRRTRRHPTSAALTRRPGAVRIPMASATSLVAHLSMPIAPARSPEPTTGTWARAHRAASVPSSPTRAVDGGEDHVGPFEEGQRRGQRGGRAPPERAPPDRHVPSRSMVRALTVEPAGAQGLADGGGRPQRDVVLGVLGHRR